MKIEAGIFDVGGVLHSTESLAVAKDIMQTLGINREDLRRVNKTLTVSLGLGEISEEEFWRQVIEQTGATRPLPTQSLWIREYGNRFKLHEEVMEIVRRLKQNGYRLGVLSNTIAPHVAFLDQQGVFDEFDVKIFSNEVRMRKPDPKIYLLTLERLGVEPGVAFFVDDFQRNVEAAQALGIAGIVFKNTQSLQRDLRKIGVRV